MVMSGVPTGGYDTNAAGMADAAHAAHAHNRLRGAENMAEWKLMHPSRLSEPMRWLDAHPESFRMECTGFGLNLVSGNYEFAALVVIDDEEFWTRYGGMIEANWESAGLRQFSSLDRDLLTHLAHDDAWANEGLFAYLQGLHRLAQLDPTRTNTPTIRL